MGCCGGGASKPLRVRKQVVNVPKQQAATPVQRKLSKKSNAAKPAGAQRQHIIPRQQCTKCGYPGMAVVVAGRERIQCSNVNCRLIMN